MIEFRNHPAQARHPITDKPLFDADGNPLPLIKDQHGIYADGYLCGYCNTDGTNVFVLPQFTSLADEIQAAAAEQWDKSNLVVMTGMAAKPKRRKRNDEPARQDPVEDSPAVPAG